MLTTPLAVTAPALSLRRAFQFAWPASKQHAGLFTAWLLTLFAAWVALEVIVVAGQDLGLLLWAVAHLAFLLFCAAHSAGLLQVCLNIHAGRHPRYAEAFQAFASAPAFLAGQLFYLLAVCVGLVLFIVPGLYLGARWAFFGFELLTAGNLLSAFQRSARLTEAVTARLAGVLGVLLLLNLLGAAVLGLGLLLTVPLSLLVLTDLYRQLESTRSPGA